MKDSPVDSVATPKVAIDWYRSTPWWRLASLCIVISWRSSHLMLCAAGLLLTHLWCVISSKLFSIETTEPSAWIRPVGWNNTLGRSLFRELGENVFETWARLFYPVMDWISAPTLASTAHMLFSMIGIVVIWSFIGGCLSRRSVVELGTRMTAPWAETIQLVVRRWQSIAWAVTMPSCLIVLLMIPPLMIGWISNIPYLGGVLAGILMIPMALASLGIGWCAAITLFGYPLAVTAVVTEKQADAYDGISTSAAYTFQRPLTLALCAVGAAFIGFVGGWMLSLVLSVGFSVVVTAYNLGAWIDVDSPEMYFSGIIMGIVPLLASAYGYSFFWTAASATYLILRRDVDHTEFDNIDMGQEPVKPLPSLPPKPRATQEESSETE